MKLVGVAWGAMGLGGCSVLKTPLAGDAAEDDQEPVKDG